MDTQKPLSLPTLTPTSSTTATYMPDVQPVILDADVLTAELATAEQQLSEYQNELGRQTAPIQANIDSVTAEITDIQTKLSALATIGVMPTPPVVPTPPITQTQPSVTP